MNPRIRELAKSVQCERHWNEEDIEKFAELIVRECIDIADEYDGVGSTIVSRIKKHFEVEL